MLIFNPFELSMSISMCKLKVFTRLRLLYSSKTYLLHQIKKDTASTFTFEKIYIVFECKSKGVSNYEN